MLLRPAQPTQSSSKYRPHPNKVHQLAIYAISCVIYNLFFSPLRHYPGPLLYRASRWPRNIRIMLGNWPQDLLALTEQYGPVIRVAPTMVIYTGADTWKEIMGNHNGAAEKGAEFGKDLYFYRSKGVGANILNETRENHSLLRRQLSHGLSDKSLREQEPIIMGYVDVFMAGLRERCGDRADPTRAGVDMRHWFNFATFDIIADLAFGEPFGCLEKGETAPQVAFIEKGLATAVPAYITKELGMEGFMKKLALNSGVVGFRKALIAKTTAVLQRRMSLKFERPDLIEGLIRKKEDWVSGSHVCFRAGGCPRTLLMDLHRIWILRLCGPTLRCCKSTCPFYLLSSTRAACPGKELTSAPSP